MEEFTRVFYRPGPDIARTTPAATGPRGRQQPMPEVRP